MSDQKRKELDTALISLIESINSFNQKELQKFSISWTDLYLLNRLDKEGQLNISEISALLKVPMFKASRITSRLEKKGYVKKKPFSKDRRTIHVVITASGRKNLEKVLNHHYLTLSGPLDGLDAADKKTLFKAVEILNKLILD